MSLFEKTLSTSGKRVALVTGVSSLAVDLSITALEVITGELEEGRGPILDTWDLIKALLIAAILLSASTRVVSRGLALFAGIFALIGITDQFLALDHLAEWLVERIDVEGLGSILPGESAAWVELVILALLASAALTLIITIDDRWGGYRQARKPMLVLLAILVFFAIGVDLIAASSRFTELATLVEETGERITLSMTFAYVAGLGVTVRES